jgi:WD40 repeat protein
MDENVYVWDMRSSGCVAERKGRAQGKGLSWCPWKANVLAYSNKDKGVSLFNTYDGEEVQRVGGVGAHIPYIGWLGE